MKLFKNFRFPSVSQWKKLPKVLSKREKIAAPLLALCFLGSALFLLQEFYISHTKVIPAPGGSVTEGIVGSPHFINPIFSDANDADRDLVQLIFSGLFKYDANGTIVPDLAKEYTISDGGKTIDVTLKENLKWSDGFPLTADDVVYTVHTFADPKYKSPARANWVGVDVQKVSAAKVRFTLQQPYAPFLERLTTKIIPAHIWQNITPENFALSVYNIQPVGSGPWRVKSSNRDKSGSIKEIHLIHNDAWNGHAPFLQTFNFIFFDTPQEAENAFRNNQIQSFSPSTLQNISGKGNSTFAFSLPRYFSLFFNFASPNSNSLVRQKDARLALARAVDQNALVQKLFGNKNASALGGKTVASPFLPEIFGLSGQGLPAGQGFAKPAENQKISEADFLKVFAKYGYAAVNGKIAKTPQNTAGLQTDLAQGSQGAEVKKLQSCLAQDKEVYPEGTISGIFGGNTARAVIKFQEKYAQEILVPNNLTAGNGKVKGSTRQKLNQLCFSQTNEAIPLALTVTTSNQYPLLDAAQIIKEQWESFGITVNIETQNSADFERNTIKPRNYEILLFGEILGTIPDPFPFWHSSQKKDPGLNLSSYDNKKLDVLLEQVRKEPDPAKRALLYQQMQDIVLADAPLITLYDTPYLYATTSNIKGIATGLIADPSQRFSGIADWYVYTTRAWK